MPIDYSKYPSNWPETRARILERAGHACEKCGLKNYQIVISVPTPDGRVWVSDSAILLGMSAEHRQTAKEVKVVLTIAHLDHDENNHNVTDDRLRAWCQLCHLRYDAPMKARRRKQKCI